MMMLLAAAVGSQQTSREMRAHSISFPENDLPRTNSCDDQTFAQWKRNETNLSNSNALSYRCRVGVGGGLVHNIHWTKNNNNQSVVYF